MSRTLKIPFFPTPREEPSSSPLTSAYGFPKILYQMLDDAELHGFDRIVSWRSDGAGFRVHHVPSFIELVAPRYFSLQKWKSFQKQCNLYGLHRVTKGANRGVYFHPHLLRGQPHLASLIQRQRKPARNSSTAAPLKSSKKGYQLSQPPPSKSNTIQEDSLNSSFMTRGSRCNVEEENGKTVVLSPKSEDLADTLRDIDHHEEYFSSSQDKKQEPFHIEPLTLSRGDSVGTFTVEDESPSSSPQMMRTSRTAETMSFSFADLEPRPLPRSSFTTIAMDPDLQKALLDTLL